MNYSYTKVRLSTVQITPYLNHVVCQKEGSVKIMKMKIFKSDSITIPKPATMNILVPLRYLLIICLIQGLYPFLIGVEVQKEV